MENNEEIKKEEITITDWELVDPLELIKAIDETMKSIEKKKKKSEIYNLLFLIRQNMFMIAGLIKMSGNGTFSKLKDEIKRLYS